MKKTIVALLFVSVPLVKGYGTWQPSGGPAASEFPRYDLKIKIAPDAHLLEAEGTILLPAAARPLENVSLALSEQMGGLKVEVLKPEASAGAAELAKTAEPGSRPGWGTNHWLVRLPHPAPAGEQILLRCSYAGGSDKTGFVFYLGPEGSFAAGINTAWYPQVEAPSPGGGDRLRATGRLDFVVPSGHKVYSLGVERGTADEREGGHFRFEINSPVYFSFGAARYTATRSAGGAVPCSLYLLRPRRNGEGYMRGALRVLDFLVREFGPYPHPEFAIVEVPQERASDAGFSGASVDGFIFAGSDLLDQDFDLPFFGHEISHQWWGNVIQTKGNRGSYMTSEALAQYGALRVVEEMEGERAAEQFRRVGYPGYSLDQSGLGYLKMLAAGLDHSLADLPESVVSHELSDSKGFLVFDLLSRTVGRRKFSRILNDFTRRHAYRPVAWEEFLGAVEKGSGRDLGWFFEEWFERTGAPDWQLTWGQVGRTLRGTITQSSPFYRLTVDVLAEGENCQRIVRPVELAGERTRFTLPLGFRVRSVVVDPEFKVPHWTPEYRAEASALAAYTSANFKRIEGKLDEAQDEFRAALARVAEPDTYGGGFMLRYGWARVLINQKKWDEAKAQLELALASPARRPETLPFVYLQLARVAKSLGDKVLFSRSVSAVITADAAAGGRTGAVELAHALEAPQ